MSRGAPTRDARPRVTALLRRDHHALRRLFDRIERSRRVERKQRLVDEVERLLIDHGRNEQPLFRLAVVAAEDWSAALLVEVEAQEHADVLGDLRQLARMVPWSSTYEEQVGAVLRRVELHLTWEEEEVFPELARRLPDDRLRELGATLAGSSAAAVAAARARGGER